MPDPAGILSACIMVVVLLSAAILYVLVDDASFVALAATVLLTPTNDLNGAVLVVEDGFRK